MFSLNTLSALSFWIAITITLLEIITSVFPYIFGSIIAALGARHIPLVLAMNNIQTADLMIISPILWMIWVYLVWNFFDLFQTFVTTPLRRGLLHRCRS
ncbi:hypothetical protein NEOLEDRAFT_1126010 [Neolentinus lepideus HHB14362 ss-1]|uniref:Uncharacterized protein n=1 Tax=Neolentinus lepideus HHB14362 ss-1 TaxID=1314782 RepID=A0A165VZZ7_9AGAM|nr:hypothetical protein NEOLEDRAFT_1126010 [Neolentinus lepideus HHB14362 ss-1]